jgi:hypothetical protein
LSNETHAPLAGLKTCGWSDPSRMAWTASPEPSARPSMRMRRPDFVFGAADSKARACSSNQVFFSLP